MKESNETHLAETKEKIAKLEAIEKLFYKIKEENVIVGEYNRKSSLLNDDVINEFGKSLRETLHSYVMIAYETEKRIKQEART